MPSVQFGNNASALTSGSSGTTAPAAGTTETWAMSSASGFPAVSATAAPPGQCIIADPSRPTEFISVTNISGLTWTVTRGAEGTVPVSHASGTTFFAVASAGGLAQLKVTDWSNAVTMFGADPTATLDSTAAIQAALSSFGTMASFGIGSGGTVYLPAGHYNTSSTLIIPSGVTLRGSGFFSTAIFLSNAVNCDMLQWGHAAATTTLSAGISGAITSLPVAALGAYILAGTVQVSNGTQVQSFTTTGATYGATSIPVSPAPVLFTFTSGNTVTDVTQANVLGVTPASMLNAFYASVCDLSLHGNSFHTTVPGYSHGISIAPSPYIFTAGTDPDFDPFPMVQNVHIEACTGDGFYHAGRSGALLIRVLSEYNNGNGISPSFDTTMVDCLVNSNGIAGIYNSHGSQTGTGCKSYNNGGQGTFPNANGQSNPWVSGAAYAAGNTASSGGVLYFCILAVTGTTAPPSDATHWAPLVATSPAAWGVGFYWDGTSGALSEHAWAACDAQQDSATSFYMKNCTTVAVQGTSSAPNYGHVTNPNYAAACTVDGSAGCTVSISGNGMAATQAYVLRIINGAASNNLAISTDGTEFARLTPDSIPIAGSSNTLIDNGVPYFNQSAYLTGTFTSAVSAAAQNVTGLGLAFTGPGVYRFRGYLPYLSPQAAGTATFAFTFSGTAGAATVITWQWHYSTTTVAPLTSQTITTASAASAAMTSSAGAYMEAFGSIQIATAGTLQLQVTNGTSTDTVSVLAGAFLEFYRVA